MGNQSDDDVDLSGVMPQRRETVRRRIAALEEYDALPRRTAPDLERLCEPLGLSGPSFYRLWRSWRTLRDPSALQGERGRRGLRDPVNDREYVREVLARLPKDGSVESMVLKIEAAAAVQGVSVRSRSALRRLVREILIELTPPPFAESPEGLIGLDIVPIEIPVLGEGGVPTLPIATTILQLRTGAILSVFLSLEPPSPNSAAAGLSRWLDGLESHYDGARIETALVPAAQGGEWIDFWNVLPRHGLDRASWEDGQVPAGDLIARAHGRRLLGLDLRPRMANRPSKERRPLVRSARLNSALPLVEAQAAIDERVTSEAQPKLFFPEASALAADLRSTFGSRLNP